MSREKRKALLHTMREDYRRAYQYKFKIKRFLKGYFLDPGYKYLVWYRLHRYFSNTPVINLWCSWRMHRIGTKAGIWLGCKNIGSGFTITHFNGIFVHAKSIGKNCSIRQDVTIGADHIPNGSIPTIGDNVEFGAGCKVLGGITVGNNVVIGANAVVVHDVPDNCVVAGIPAKVIKYIN